MKTFVALLRGVNILGHKPVRMAPLRESLESLGFRDVTTYLQSGNVVFNAPGGAPREHASTIRSCLARTFGHDVSVLVLPSSEIDAIAGSNPLGQPTESDQKLFHVTFLFEAVPRDTFEKLVLPAREGEQAVLAGRAVMLHCPYGYGRTKLNNSFFEKALDVQATTRNWRTVLAIRRLCREGRGPGVE